MNRETLFWTALRLPPSERPAFLDAACEDPAERAWVEAMLEADSKLGGGGFLAPPDISASQAPTLPAAGSDDIPDGRTGSETRLGADIFDLAKAGAPAPPQGVPKIPGCELQGELGRGGIGVVYKGRQPGLDREVAVKLLQARIVDDEEHAERFRREARAMAQLAHPNIVAIHDSGETSGGHAYFVMEFVDGTDLLSRIRAGDMSEDEALRIAVAVGEALAFAHGEKFIHRDIKPQNILIGDDGAVKVADFGLVKLIENPGLTREGAVMGTPLYWAPEQSDPDLVSHLDHRADIYALGGTLYHMLCGVVPDKQYVPPSTLCGCDRRLDAVVARCLEPDPELRYSTADELVSDLREIRQTRPLRFRLLANAAAIILALAAATMASRTPVAHRLDAMIQDLWITSRPAPAVSDQLVVVAITDDCLRAERLGAWPWDRTLHARLIDRLAVDGASAIAFDLFLPENGEGALTTEGDAALAAAAGRHGGVIFPDFLDSPSWTVAVYEKNAEDASVLAADEVQYAASVIREQGSIPAQCQVERDDADGKLRRVPLFLVDPADPGRPRPNLGLALAMELEGPDAAFSWVRGAVEIERPGRPPVSIPTAPLKRVLVNYPEFLDSIPRVAYSDVLEGRSDFDFEDKAVLIGFTATGTTHVTADKHVTVIDPLTPGVLVNATIANSTLTGEFLREGSRWASLAAGLALALILAFVLLRTRILAAALLGFAFCGAIYAGGLGLVAADGLVLPAMPALLTVIFAMGTLLLAVRVGRRLPDDSDQSSSKS